jgi:hypothetical protein
MAKGFCSVKVKDTILTFRRQQRQRQRQTLQNVDRHIWASPAPVLAFAKSKK